MPAEFEATDTRSPDQRKQRFFWKCGPLGTYCLIVFPFLLVSLILINLTDQEQWLSLSLLSIGIVCVLSGLVTWWERNEVKEFIRFQSPPYQIDFSERSYFYMKRKGILDAIEVLQEIEGPTTRMSKH